MQHKEFDLQRQCIAWLRIQHKDLIFVSDSVAFMKMTPQQAARNKTLQCHHFSCPDILILKPNAAFKMLAIEMKIKSPFKQNGELYSNEHLEEQAESIKKLNELGYCATFCWSFDQFQQIITDYLKIK